MDAPDPSDTTTLRIASWDDRFWAWLIDVLVVGAIVSGLGEAANVFALLTGGVGAPFAGANGVALWLYWTGLEGRNGQSAGKMVMNIAVRDERGEPIDYATAAIESLGKAFLLPLDCLVGWLAMSGEHVRLFNRLSGTIVVEVPEREPPEGVEYVRPKK